MSAAGGNRRRGLAKRLDCALAGIGVRRLQGIRHGQGSEEIEPRGAQAQGGKTQEEQCEQPVDQAGGGRGARQYEEIIRWPPRRLRSEERRGGKECVSTGRTRG